MSGVFIIRGDKELIEMTEEQYESEDFLQELLEKYPQLLAGKQINESDPRRWLLVSREAGLQAEEGGGSRWAVDHLFLDQDGIPTIVEVKRSSDTRIRREVVGQMMDYASNAVVYWPLEKINTMFERTCEDNNDDPDEKLAEFIGQEQESGTYWEKVKTNLQAGKIRMVFVADKIPSELQRIVEFLNEQMDPAEVLAVEIKQFTGDQLRTLVPRVIGITSEAKKRKSTGLEPKQWDEESFFDRLDDKQAKIARKLLEWSKSNMQRIWWGRGVQDGSFIPNLDYKGTNYFVIAVRTGSKNNPVVQIQFDPLSKRPPFDDEKLRLELLDRLNEIPEVNLPQDSISRYPSIPIRAFYEESSFQRLIEVLEWTIQKIKS
jgi:hypothetical protein